MNETVQQVVNDPGAHSHADRDAARVEKNIGQIILAFCTERLFDYFFMSELNEYIEAKGEKIAPESAGRILRLLRAKGLVDVSVIDRSNSKYVVNGVA